MNFEYPSYYASTIPCFEKTWSPSEILMNKFSDPFLGLEAHHVNRLVDSIPESYRALYTKSFIDTRRREVIEDKAIHDLLNSIKHFRNIDNVATKLTQGCPIQPSEIVREIFKDRVTDYRTVSLANALLLKRNTDKLESGCIVDN